MFSDVLDSIRWGRLGVTAAVMAVILIVHFAWARPLARKLRAEALKMRLELRCAELQFSVQRVTQFLLQSLVTPVNSAQLADQATRLRTALRQIEGPPELLQAMQDLAEATTKLAAAAANDKAALESGALRLANACVAVEHKLPTLVLASTDVA